MTRPDPCDVGALLRAAVAAYQARHPGTSDAAVARLAGLDPVVLSRALRNPNASPETARAVCLAIGVRFVVEKPTRAARKESK